MKKHMTIIKSILILSIALILSSCAGRGEEEKIVYKVYYPNKDYTALLSKELKSLSDNSVDTMLTYLKAKPDEPGVAAVSGYVSVNGHTLKDGKLLMDFGKNYEKLNPTEEVLTRAAIVETLTQSPDVNTVQFEVEGKELRDINGNVVGDMTGDSFITNTGEELNFYAKANVTLYFTDVNGSVLNRYDESMVYATNLSMEKCILETLLKGPSAVGETNAYPTLPPDAKLLNVTVKDRIAYANFDKAIREAPYSVKEEVALYSIVNSLTALPGVDQVQISVDGSTEGVFLDHMPLDALYERNDEIIK